MMKIDLSGSNKYLKVVPPNWVNDPGAEPYHFYAHQSLKLKDGAKISDLGTYMGLSALAMSINDNVSITSYDIDLSHNLVEEKDNIEFVLGNVFDYIEEILQSDLILVDIDPHDGIQEQRFYDILEESNYKGITIWDDINLNLGMKNFWHKVKREKHDVTNKGHHSGTGLIVFT